MIIDFLVYILIADVANLIKKLITQKLRLLIFMIV